MLNKGRVIVLDLKFKSFYWSLGTTSFRTKNFNKKIEQQLSLLRNFWSVKENIGRDWEEKIQIDYYNFLKEVGFISGDANNKAKDAREKTSGLVSLGLIDENRRLTEVGNELLKFSEENSFSIDNIFGLPADSFIYFRQLLKTSVKIDNEISRPFIVTTYLITKLGGLSYDEFKYILPLCIDKRTTLKAVEDINLLRKNKLRIDDIIFSRLMDRYNYKLALKYFFDAKVVTEDIIADIGMNRKSRNYDRAYFPLYVALHKFYVGKDKNAVNEILAVMKKISNTGTHWQNIFLKKYSD